MRNPDPWPRIISSRGANTSSPKNRRKNGSSIMGSVPARRVMVFSVSILTTALPTCFTARATKLPRSTVLGIAARILLVEASGLVTIDLVTIGFEISGAIEVRGIADNCALVRAMELRSRTDEVASVWWPLRSQASQASASSGLLNSARNPKSPTITTDRTLRTNSDCQTLIKT